MCGGPGPNVHLEMGFPAVSVSLILPSLGGLQMSVSVGLSHRQPPPWGLCVLVCVTLGCRFGRRVWERMGGIPYSTPSGSGILESPFFLVPPPPAGGRAAGHGG